MMLGFSIASQPIAYHDLQNKPRENRDQPHNDKIIVQKILSEQRIQRQYHTPKMVTPIRD